MRIVGNRVLIAPYEKKTELPSGLILPDQAQEEQTRGVVLGVGPGRVSDRGILIEIADVESGDVVLYSKYGGTTIEVEGEEMLLVDPKDIFCVLTEGDAE